MIVRREIGNEGRAKVPRLARNGTDLAKLVPDFGKQPVVAPKAIRSRAVKGSEKVRQDGQAERGGEHDASVAEKKQFVERKDGKLDELLYKWFGFVLNLAVDSVHQLIVAIEAAGRLENDLLQLKPLLEDLGRNTRRL